MALWPLLLQGIVLIALCHNFQLLSGLRGSNWKKLWPLKTRELSNSIFFFFDESKCVFGKRICTSQTHVLRFSYLFFFFEQCLQTYKFHFSATFSLKIGLTVLFTHLKIILLQCFSVFSFQLYPNGPLFKLLILYLEHETMTQLEKDHLGHIIVLSHIIVWWGSYMY